ncbi:unnamed protein product [Victoria cruziana]
MGKYAVPPPPWLKRVYDRVGSFLKKADPYEAKARRDFPVLERHDRAKEFAEDRTSLESDAPATKGAAAAQLKEFKIYRWNPDAPQRPYLHSFHLNLKECGPMILDALQKIKAEYDPTLAYRKSCREGICGSCSMNIDGTNTVACLKPISADTLKATIITPLPHMCVTKDLVVDLSSFYNQYKSVEPWLKTRNPPPGRKEYLQSPQSRKKLDGLYECILCACCSAACPSYWWNPEEFLGPAALIHAYRWIQDSRDDYTKERLQSLTESHQKLYRCRAIVNCTASCPKSLSPAHAITMMKKKHLYSV